MDIICTDISLCRERFSRSLPCPRSALLLATLALNGETLFEGDDPALANVLFGIWLDEEPLGEAFRDDLLGR